MQFIQRCEQQNIQHTHSAMHVINVTDYKSFDVKH